MTCLGNDQFDLTRALLFITVPLLYLHCSMGIRQTLHAAFLCFTHFVLRVNEPHGIFNDPRFVIKT